MGRPYNVLWHMNAHNILNDWIASVVAREMSGNKALGIGLLRNFTSSFGLVWGRCRRWLLPKFDGTLWEGAFVNHKVNIFGQLDKSFAGRHHH